MLRHALLLYSLATVVVAFGPASAEEVLYHNSMAPGEFTLADSVLAPRSFELLDEDHDGIPYRPTSGGLRFSSNGDALKDEVTTLADPKLVLGNPQGVAFAEIAPEGGGGTFETGFDVGADEYIEFDTIVRYKDDLNGNKNYWNGDPNLEGGPFDSLVNGVNGVAFIAPVVYPGAGPFDYQTVCVFMTRNGIYAFQDANRNTAKKLADRDEHDIHHVGLRYDRGNNLLIWKLEGRIVAIWDQPGSRPGPSADPLENFTTLADTGAASDFGPGSELPTWYPTAFMTIGGEPYLGVIDSGGGARKGMVPVGPAPGTIPESYAYSQAELNADVIPIMLGTKEKKRPELTIYDWKVVRGSSPPHGYDVSGHHYGSHP
jgi:hypothetical protein